MMEKREREIWIDFIKVIACILVVLGHFFQSMTKSGIIYSNYVFEWFNQTIYYIHVQLFFIASGYLYQKYTVVNSFSSWINNVRKKLIYLGIPYFVFSTITWVLKSVFSASVNEQIGSLKYILFVEPTAPYWYLYCLFMIFCITITFFNRKLLVFYFVAGLMMKFFSYHFFSIGSYTIANFLGNEIWFVLGMAICSLICKKRDAMLKKSLGVFLLILFGIMSVLSYIFKINFKGFDFFMGIIGCMAIVIISLKHSFSMVMNKIIIVVGKYTMPIFLMHTIFAAAIRSILMKIGVNSSNIHIIVGLIVSFGCPVIAAKIMEHNKYSEALIRPNVLLKK